MVRVTNVLNAVGLSLITSDEIRYAELNNVTNPFQLDPCICVVGRSLRAAVKSIANQLRDLMVHKSLKPATPDEAQELTLTPSS